jgi:dephospho-CoA kinase
MLKLKKVAVTGGLACGKSSVCRFFEKLGATVVNADEIVHRLLSPETNLGQKVIQLIGSDIIVNNQIDRSKIAQKVFNQSPLLHALEQLTHPAVLEEIEKKYKQASQQKNVPLFVAEVPLLFETEMEPFFDAVITVIADPAISKQRFLKATGNSSDDYDNRLKRQLPAFDKARRADYVIINDGSMQKLEEETKKLMNILTH